MSKFETIPWKKEEIVDKKQSTSMDDSKLHKEVKFSGKKKKKKKSSSPIEIMRMKGNEKTRISVKQRQNLRFDNIEFSHLPPLLFGAVSVKEKGKDVENKFRSWDVLKANLAFESMWICLQFVYLYPKNYEFHKVDIIHLWMAQELVPFPPFEDMEFNARFYFKEFQRIGIFQLSRLDHSVGKARYRLNSSIFSLLENHHHDQYFRKDDGKSRISQNTIHSSLRASSFDPVNLKELYAASRLSTLLMLHEHGFQLDQVPRDTFLNLHLLRVVDLSGTDIKYLPSSVGNLKDLRYLNLSQTPITTLPRTLCSLDQMQILKLRGCVKLTTVPKCMRRLINLRHLDVDVAPLLVSMPPGFGDLTELETLPAFVVGKENGCHINELKNIRKLRGTLKILRLENISSLKEVKDASLDEMIYLQSLELQWTLSQDGLNVLENLQPPRGIEELEIVGYGGATFPSWIGDPLFLKLMTINISDCRMCELLPPLGKLPSLESLSINDMNAVNIIDRSFCGRGLLELETFPTTVSRLFRSESAFQMLGKLTLNEMPNLEKWIGIKAGDFPRLQKLSISRCSKLTTLPKVSLLESLRKLEITLCPLLASFPEEGLPTSLQFLSIIECRLLKEWCRKEMAQDRGKLSYIHNLWIDYQQVYKAQPSQTTGTSPLSSSPLSFESLRTTEPVLPSSIVDEGRDAKNSDVDSLSMINHFGGAAINLWTRWTKNLLKSKEGEGEHYDLSTGGQSLGGYRRNASGVGHNQICTEAKVHAVQVAWLRSYFTEREKEQYSHTIAAITKIQRVFRIFLSREGRWVRVKPEPRTVEIDALGSKLLGSRDDPHQVLSRTLLFGNYSTTLRAYENEYKLNHNLQSVDAIFQDQTKHVIKSLFADVEYRVVSLGFLNEVTGCLLEMNEEVIKVLLHCQEDVGKNKSFFRLVAAYVEYSLPLLQFCDLVDIRHLRGSLFYVNAAVQQFKEEECEKNYLETLWALQNFTSLRRNFARELFRIIESVNMHLFVLIKRVESEISKLSEKLKSSDAGRMVPSIILVTAFTSSLICSVLETALVAPPIAAALKDATLVPLGSEKNWFDSLWKMYKDTLIGQTVKPIQVSSYISIKDLDEIEVLVDQAESRTKSLFRDPDFGIGAIQSGNLWMEEIKEKMEVFTKSFESLREHTNTFREGMKKVTKIMQMDQATSSFSPEFTTAIYLISGQSSYGSSSDEDSSEPLLPLSQYQQLSPSLRIVVTEGR